MKQNSANIKADILVIDDVPDNIRLLSKMLLEQGYNVRKAITGQIALAAIQSLPPDLILLDINMPKMDGYEVCRMIKANVQTRSIPVIFISALDEIIDKAQAFQVGAVDYITKPFQFEEVFLRIQNQLTIRNLQSQMQMQKLQLQQALSEHKTISSQSAQSDRIVNSLISEDELISVREFIQNLLKLIFLYQQEYPIPTPLIQEAIKKMNSSLLSSNLQKFVDSNKL
jgi:CheY-like chemotaxis protein